MPYGRKTNHDRSKLPVFGSESFAKKKNKHQKVNKIISFIYYKRKHLKQCSKYQHPKMREG